jgi:hypothetical protein
MQRGNNQDAPGISCGLSETRGQVQEQAKLIAGECMASYGSPTKYPRWGAR